MCCFPRGIPRRSSRRLRPEDTLRHGDGYACPGHQIPASAAVAPSVPAGHGPVNATGRRSPDPDHASPGPQGPAHHRGRIIPSALDNQRAANGHDTIRTERQRDAFGCAVGRPAFPRRQTTRRRTMVPDGAWSGTFPTELHLKADIRLNRCIANGLFKTTTRP